MSHHISGVTLHPEQYPTDRHYPFNLPVFRQTKQLRFEFPVTFFAGDNGSGKSTLLEAIALACEIHIWRKHEFGRYEVNPYEKQLFQHVSVEWINGRLPGSYFGSEIFHDFRRILDVWAASDPGQLKYFGGKSLMTQSHGQSMMAYFRACYSRRGIYFLDEPETALSPNSMLELMDIIQVNSEAGHAQFIIATHSPILLAFKGAGIYSFDQSPLRVIPYRETAPYKIYRRFLIDR